MLKHLPLLPSHGTLEMMVKVAVAVRFVVGTSDELTVLSTVWSTLEDQQFIGTGLLEVGDKALTLYLGV